MVPLVSVIIPTYNRAALVGEAVASVQTQTYRDYEILVVDDGSDRCHAGGPGRLAGVRVRRHPGRRGVAVARNTGHPRPGGSGWPSWIRTTCGCQTSWPGKCLC